ncbi:potassium transporter TrkA [Amycolatopsis anabasis]|uniref:potassium transporter TrkA n=1 Tax=Amycolatopsis anabasis TaxID=1840409 RepID=UPI00131E8646|nr:potassium transporter TrkA [Amycolatopsis anabasis]
MNPVNTADSVVVLGTGAFATAFTQALAQHARRPTRIVVVGRTTAAGRDLLRNIAPAGRAAHVTALCTATDLGLHADLRPLICQYLPRVVVVCASLHSPYYAAGAADSWTRLVDAAEFGFTAPLQAATAVRAAQAIASTGLVDCQLVNACYPDLVNPLLVALGLPVLCGLGNVATLAEALASLLPHERCGIRVVAHHRHLKPGITAEEEAWVQMPGADGPAVTGALARIRAWPRRRRNDLGAAAGGRLVARLLSGATVRTSLPGIGPLPGGYPVLAGLRGCELDLPAPWPRQTAVAEQERHARREGVTVHDGKLTYWGATRDLMRRIGLAEDGTVPVAEWNTAAQALIALRHRLRRSSGASPSRLPV